MDDELSRQVEFGVFLVGMLSRVLDELDVVGVRGLEGLEAAYGAHLAAAPGRPAVRRMGMDRTAAWRILFEVEMARPSAAGVADPDWARPSAGEQENPPAELGGGIPLRAAGNDGSARR